VTWLMRDALIPYSGARSRRSYTRAMTNPTPVNPGGWEGAQPVFAVPEWSPGVEVVQAFPGGEFAQQVNVVPEMGHGVRPVYFVGGLPPDPVRQTQEQMAMAYHAQQVQRAQAEQVGTVQPQPQPPVQMLLITILSA
jgi:hypothetical protein